jgi:SAM-dependent methyltransferase
MATALATHEVLCFRCGVPGVSLWSRGGFSMRRCPMCSQRFVSPRTDGFAELYDTDDYFAGMNETNQLAARCRSVWFRARHQLIDRALADAPGRRALIEIGPSWGEFVESSLAHGYSVAASEFSARSASVVADRFGIPVQAGAFAPSFFVDHGFSNVDVVCMWDVIEHVPEPGAFVDAVASVMRPGAVLAFSCPDARSPLARLLRRRWHTFKPDEHLWHFEQATMTRLLEDHGFEVRWLSSNPLRRVQLLRPDCMTGIAVRR